MLTLLDKRITFSGKLKDPESERDYERQNFPSSRKFLSAALIAAGILFLLFFIPQSLTGGMRRFGGAIAAVRVITVAFFFVASALIVRAKTFSACRVILLIVSALFPAAYLAVIALSSQLDYPIKCMDIIVVLTLLFLSPLDWPSLCCGAGLILLEFFVAIRLLLPGLSAETYITGMVYVLLSAGLSSMVNLRSNRLKRRQFLNSRALLELIDYDYLTGAYSRVRFDTECRKQIDESQKGGIPFSLAVFDIDDFKHINDTYGHLVGDRILIRLSSLIRESLMGYGTLARWGGEEFTLILPGHGVAEAERKVCGLRQNIFAADFEHGIRITCSFGVAQYHPGEPMDTLIDRADQLMYRAKNAGKNRVETET